VFTDTVRSVAISSNADQRLQQPEHREHSLAQHLLSLFATRIGGQHTLCEWVRGAEAAVLEREECADAGFCLHEWSHSVKRLGSG
jgi:hypothetical protein